MRPLVGLAVSSSIRDKDNGFRELFARIAKGKPVTVTVGVHAEEGAASDGKTTVAEVATYNEFGLGPPERSFIRDWADQHEDRNLNMVRKIAESVVTGKGPTPDQAFDQIGLRFVGEIQARISGGIPPPNAPSTIAQKGSSTPLINTGQLRSSIRHKVKRGSLGGDE